MTVDEGPPDERRAAPAPPRAARRRGLRAEAPPVEAVERALADAWIAAPGTSLRDEDRKKAVEVAALLGELAAAPRDGLLVDAAAGKAYVGLLAGALLGFRRIVLVERDPRRAADAEAAAARLFSAASRAPAPTPAPTVDVRVGALDDPALFPAAADTVVALHACGAAADATIDAAIRAGARRLLLVACCYADAVPFAARARDHADALGLPRAPPVRRRFVESLVDAERALRLEAAGYETTALAFVAPTVTPHNLLLRARLTRDPTRAAAAATSLARLRGASPPAGAEAIARPPRGA